MQATVKQIGLQDGVDQSTFHSDSRNGPHWGVLIYGWRERWRCVRLVHRQPAPTSLSISLCRFIAHLVFQTCSWFYLFYAFKYHLTRILFAALPGFEPGSGVQTGVLPPEDYCAGYSNESVAQMRNDC